MFVDRFWRVILPVIVYCDQRLPRLRSRLLAPALSGSGSEPGARAGAGNFGVGSGSRVQSRSQASQRTGSSLAWRNAIPCECHVFVPGPREVADNPVLTLGICPSRPMADREYEIAEMGLQLAPERSPEHSAASEFGNLMDPNGFSVLIEKVVANMANGGCKSR
ncbi:unnamed protein product [Bursaphelenchus xylophilus]|uniref:(pine wood nematode) hypothetical protein n=1 Tax=Bursaphelenchus xylophilus TaxID=6326 RepID=A0A1I7RIJ9_BURXY|nr:unnamed protein product [Bursaphelenchus xylophilus]CAG9118826.1 unnamed protein product [Bursaphelenchus xylophilus]